MLDPGTILAIVSLAGQVIGGVTKVIGLFDSISNAPEELREFRVSASRLQRHFTAFQAELEASGSTPLHPEDVEQIEDTLILCSQLFSEHEDALRNQADLNGVFRATWTARSNGKLTKYKAKIDSHYQQILLPAWVKSMELTRANRLDEIQTNNQTIQTTEEPNINVPVIPLDDIELLSQGISNLKAAIRRDVTQRTLHDLDETLQRCWTRLGLPVEEIFDNAGLTASYLDRQRASSVSYEVVPTTLTLENAPEKHRRLKLKRVHIMARDDQSRILLYQNSDMSVHVTHIIPYGSIPWTEDKDSTRVSFLTRHVITVVDNEGHHLYHIDPKYGFKDLQTCEKFQSTLRERDLLDAFMAVEISQAGTVLSRRQVIRFWVRKSSENGKIVTMTFLENSVGSGRQHKELDIGDFQQDPRFIVPRPFWPFGRHRQSAESETLDLVSFPMKTMRIKFETVQDSRDFKSRFKNEHPRNTRAPQLELAYFSSASTSLSTTPAPTPSDKTWSTGPPPSDTSGFDLDDDIWNRDLAPIMSASKDG